MRLLIISGVIVLLMACASVKDEEPVLEIRIDEAQTFQTIHHFGASAAWWAQLVGTWDDDTVGEIMDLLFDDELGIGLDLIRYNLGGGRKITITTDPLRSAETPETEPGTFDWQRDAAAVSLIDEAVKRGAWVVLFSNSPPERLTVTGAASGNGSSTNLIAGGEEAFAAYLVGAAESLRTSRGWPIIDISPINEPQWTWGTKNGQEGSHWTPEEAARMVLALHREMSRRNPDYGISAIDSGEMSVGKNAPYLKALDEKTLLGSVLSHYAVHSYWSSGVERAALWRYLKKHHADVELWMTEWTEMKGGRDVGMDSALTLAATVHEDMTLANASSWQYWIAVSPYNYRDGLIYIDPPTRQYRVTKRLWALGHWSRFLQPEALRVSSEFLKGRGVLHSSYLNPDGSAVVVAVNLNRNKAQRLKISGAPEPLTEMEIYVTDEHRNLARMSAESDGSATLPPASIATVVFTQ